MCARDLHMRFCTACACPTPALTSAFLSLASRQKIAQQVSRSEAAVAVLGFAVAKISSSCSSGGWQQNAPELQGRLCTSLRYVSQVTLPVLSWTLFGHVLSSSVRTASFGPSACPIGKMRARPARPTRLRGANILDFFGLGFR